MAVALLAAGLQDVLDATAGAPWLWWAVTLLLLLGLLVLAMRWLGLWPE